MSFAQGGGPKLPTPRGAVGREEEKLYGRATMYGKRVERLPLGDVGTTPMMQARVPRVTLVTRVHTGYIGSAADTRPTGHTCSVTQRCN